MGFSITPFVPGAAVSATSGPNGEENGGGKGKWLKLKQESRFSCFKTQCSDTAHRCGLVAKYSVERRMPRRDRSRQWLFQRATFANEVLPNRTLLELSTNFVLGLRLVQPNRFWPRSCKSARSRDRPWERDTYVSAWRIEDK